MKTNLFFWYCILCAAGLSSCQLDFDDLFGNNKSNGKYPDVDEALWPYFLRFEEEAAARGLQVDLADAYITGHITEIKTSQVLGQCSYSGNNPYLVTIDKTFWDRASDLFREFVVFHELGHCYLGRLHDESMDARSICRSIMRSGTGSCKDNYNTSTRAGLINELFANAD